MYVYLDTNIFFQNWYLQSPHFSKLISYCNDTNATLLLPQVVVEEVQAKFEQDATKVLKELADKWKLCERHGYAGSMTPMPLVAANYDFLSVVKNEFDFVEVISYDDVSHRVLVKKAIGAKRPFTDSEKGYRDALIWHSLIDFIRSKDEGVAVAFVSANSKDFFKKDSALPEFHADLEADLVEGKIENRFLLYRSLDEFVSSNKVVVGSDIDTERLEAEYLGEIESRSELAAMEYLNGLQKSGLQKFLATGDFCRHTITHVLDADWEIFEGTEDPEIVSATLLPTGLIYLKYRFNLRSISLTATMPASAYFEQRDAVDDDFWQVVGDDSLVHLDGAARCDFVASVTIEPKNRYILELSIDSATLRNSKRPRQRF